MNKKVFYKTMFKYIICTMLLLCIIVAYCYPKFSSISNFFDDEYAFNNGQEVIIELKILVAHGGLNQILDSENKVPITDNLKDIIQNNKQKLIKPKQIIEKTKEITDKALGVGRTFKEKADTLIADTKEKLSNKNKEKEHVEEAVKKNEEDKQNIINTNKEEKIIENSEPELENELNKTENKSNKIALVIVGLGLNHRLTEEALALPAEISLGFSPYAADLETWIAKSKDQKHDVLINLPMEPLNYPYDDAGPFTLLSDLADEDNVKRLEYIKNRVSHFDGLYTIEEEKFSKNINRMEPIIRFLQKNNIKLVYGNGFNNSALLQLAASLEYNFYNSITDIDAEITKEYIQNSLQNAVEEATNKGQVIIIGNSYPITLKEIQFWIPTLKDKNIELIPISQLN